MLSSTTVCKVNGYHFTIDATSDVDENDAWEIACGEVGGRYRGDVQIDGARCVLFTDENTGKRYAALPQNVQFFDTAE